MSGLMETQGTHIQRMLSSRGGLTLLFSVALGRQLLCLVNPGIPLPASPDWRSYFSTKPVSVTVALKITILTILISSTSCFEVNALGTTNPHKHTTTVYKGHYTSKLS